HALALAPITSAHTAKTLAHRANLSIARLPARSRVFSIPIASSSSPTSHAASYVHRVVVVVVVFVFVVLVVVVDVTIIIFFVVSAPRGSHAARTPFRGVLKKRDRGIGSRLLRIASGERGSEVVVGEKRGHRAGPSHSRVSRLRGPKWPIIPIRV
ncbi:MAG: hypothetical protein P8J59_06990, partial [Phycisphaerales bacterium]|nr:hypothetical protein [Phycisphaerales bacterium]